MVVKINSHEKTMLPKHIVHKASSWMIIKKMAKASLKKFSDARAQMKSNSQPAKPLRRHRWGIVRHQPFIWSFDIRSTDQLLLILTPFAATRRNSENQIPNWTQQNNSQFASPYRLDLSDTEPGVCQAFPFFSTSTFPGKPHNGRVFSFFFFHFMDP